MSNSALQPGHRPNDREDPRDCNPMFKRLPAEVTTRSRRDVVKSGPTEAADATVDMEQVVGRKPEGRAKWLAKALAQAEEGRIEPQVLYDIITASRFVDDLTEKVGKKMYRSLRAHLKVFSSKQRKYLEKDCQLAKKYAAAAFGGAQKDEDAMGDSEAKASSMEDMMARVRAFVRDKQVQRGERGEDGEAEEGAGEAGGSEAPAAASPADAPADAAAEASSGGEGKPKEKEKQKEKSKPKGKERGRSGSRLREKKGKRKESSSSSRGSSSRSRRGRRGRSKDRKAGNSSKNKGRRASSSRSSSSDRRGKKKRRR